MRLISIFVLVFFAGCVSKPTEISTKSWIDLPELGQGLIVTMQLKAPPIKKTFTLNGVVETKQFNTTDSSFWATELDWLLTTDLNSPQLKGVLEAQPAEQDSKSNLTIRSIRPIEDTNTELQKLDILYLEDMNDIRQIHLVTKSSNYISSSKKAVSLYMNKYNGELLIDSLQLDGEEKVIFQDKRLYHSLTMRIK
jgi:hypothetical protein